MFYNVLKLFRLLMALLMGVVMDLLDFGPKLCAKLYFLRHRNDRKKGDLPIGIATTKTAEFGAFLWQQMSEAQYL